MPYNLETDIFIETQIHAKEQSVFVFGYVTVSQKYVDHNVKPEQELDHMTQLPYIALW